MWTLSTIAKRIARIALAVAFVVAPMAPASAACISSQPAMQVTAEAGKRPCDTPCKDCSPGAKTSCQGDCIVATTTFTALAYADASVRAVPDARVDPETVTMRRALVRPPDTPPPRFLLAQF